MFHPVRFGPCSLASQERCATTRSATTGSGGISMAHTFLAAAFVVTTAVAGYATPTPAPTSPPGPVAVTACGQTVTSDAYLAHDLDCPTDTAVVLAGDGVDLDLRGHVLRGSRESNGIVLPGYE